MVVGFPLAIVPFKLPLLIKERILPLADTIRCMQRVMEVSYRWWRHHEGWRDTSLRVEVRSPPRKGPSELPLLMEELIPPLAVSLRGKQQAVELFCRWQMRYEAWRRQIHLLVVRGSLLAGGRFGLPLLIKEQMPPSAGSPEANKR